MKCKLLINKFKQYLKIYVSLYMFLYNFYVFLCSLCF